MEVTSEYLQEMKKRINKIANDFQNDKGDVKNEEATKTFFILPFIRDVLLYSQARPSEFQPEYEADFPGRKKDERVDYAILRENRPIILIEAKHWEPDLQEKHEGQLSRYFNAINSECKRFAILTNGFHYKFYTDLDNANVMDKDPFLDFEIASIPETKLRVLAQFAYDVFDPQQAHQMAIETKASEIIYRTTKEILDPPTEDFVSLVVKVSGVLEKRNATKSIIGSYKSHVERAIKRLIEDRVNLRLDMARKINSDQVEDKVESPEPEQKEKVIETTKNEIEAYYIIKNFFLGTPQYNRVSYQDKQTYMTIVVDNKPSRWICRLRITDTRKSIEFKDNQVSTLNAVSDLYQFRDRLVAQVESIIANGSKVTEQNSD
jgi:hypothetical protein